MKKTDKIVGSYFRGFVYNLSSEIPGLEERLWSTHIFHLFHWNGGNVLVKTCSKLMLYPLFGRLFGLYSFGVYDFIFVNNWV